MNNPNRFGPFLSTVIGLTVIVGLGYLFIRLTKLFFGALETLKPEITGPSIAAIIAIVGSVLVLAIGKIMEKRIEVDAAFRERRLKTYETFIATIDGLGEGKTAGSIGPVLKRMNTEVILWAGPALLKSYVAFYRQAARDSGSGRMFLAWEDLYKKMRVDLGHSNSGLASGDILALRIKLSELDEVLPRILAHPDEKVTFNP